MEMRRKKEVDVLVVGGGCAGLGAAIAAARNGVRVLLVEGYGFLGGTVTQALVVGLLTQYAGDRRVIGGIPQELTDRLLKAGAANRIRVPMSTAPQIVIERIEVDPEMLKLAADELVEATGVELWLHSHAVDALVDGKTVRGALIHTKSGPCEVDARVVVDATGDGDVAVWAGSLYEQGNIADQTLQPMTMYFRAGNVDVAAALGFWKSAERSTLMQTACERGELPAEYMALHAPGWTRDVIVGMTRISGRDPMNVSDLTRAEIEGRLQAQRAMAFLIRNFPGFERAYLVQTGPKIGVRESRRILGDYVLTGKDVVEARHFEDGIAQGSYPVDMHLPGKTDTTFIQLPPDKFYDIPYRCLLPRGLEGILVAGRCFSATREGFGSARVSMICMAMGEAAGTAAAMCVQRNCGPRQIDPKQLRENLKVHGVLC
jgi:hypothetical protein